MTGAPGWGVWNNHEAVGRLCEDVNWGVTGLELWLESKTCPEHPLCL